MGPFIYYVITFLGFLDPPPPLRKHVFSTENNQKLAFSDPPSPPTSDYVIYEWSLMQMPFTKNAEMLLTYELLHVNSKDWDRAKERPVHQPIQKGRPRWH